jgi:hypothetical protein
MPIVHVQDVLRELAISEGVKKRKVAEATGKQTLGL